MPPTGKLHELANIRISTMYVYAWRAFERTQGGGLGEKRTRRTRKTRTKTSINGSSFRSGEAVGERGRASLRGNFYLQAVRWQGHACENKKGFLGLTVGGRAGGRAAAGAPNAPAALAVATCHSTDDVEKREKLRGETLHRSGGRQRGGSSLIDDGRVTGRNAQEWKPGNTGSGSALLITGAFGHNLSSAKIPAYCPARFPLGNARSDGLTQRLPSARTPVVHLLIPAPRRRPLTWH